ncbi:calcium-binding protein (plasmid) [Sinorhizobium meliloti]|nr:calcium-binding protein [Sinorhizobium meliloti]WQP05267.1 calcium-binding protein [Sinorhizobium meliloti]WQP12156.1 calcium-binding protein [Sinorhizobium meliloti]WQP18572.1 calcium-binding protein [Sinorhizobium meliloti]WQP25629.1 calcium-binding protein [Sinorhizobium meliloti]
MLDSEGGSDEAHGGSGNDRISVGAGNDRAFGDDGDDILTSGAGDDYLSGGIHQDRLFGGTGNDTLRGDAGRDVLSGDAGSDILWGGSDSDRFVFKGLGALSGQDTVMDFQDGLDLLAIETLGVKQYSNSGAAGTIYAYDATGGDVLVKGYNSAGNAFSILVDDPNGSLTAANFSRADFVFA